MKPVSCEVLTCDAFILTSCSLVTFRLFFNLSIFEQPFLNGAYLMSEDVLKLLLWC